MSAPNMRARIRRTLVASGSVVDVEDYDSICKWEDDILTAMNQLAALAHERAVQLTRLTNDLESKRHALWWIDNVLTTVEGDGYPQGDAPKMHARNIARYALMSDAEKDAHDAEVDARLVAAADPNNDRVRRV